MLTHRSSQSTHHKLQRVMYRCLKNVGSDWGKVLLETTFTTGTGYVLSSVIGQQQMQESMQAVAHSWSKDR